MVVSETGQWVWQACWSLCKRSMRSLNPEELTFDDVISLSTVQEHEPSAHSGSCLLNVQSCRGCFQFLKSISNFSIVSGAMEFTGRVPINFIVRRI